MLYSNIRSTQEHTLRRQYGLNVITSTPLTTGKSTAIVSTSRGQDMISRRSREYFATCVKRCYYTISWWFGLVAREFDIGSRGGIYFQFGIFSPQLSFIP